MESIFGGLFTYESKEALDNFIVKLDEDSSKKIIELCLIHCQKTGIFTFEESRIIYECLKKIKENEKNILSNNNSDGDIIN